MSESQSAGGIHYDVSMDIKELLVGEKQVNKVMDNVEKSTDKATDSLNRLDKTASQVATAMKMPELNKLSRDMAQLSGKIGANSLATEKAMQTNSKFTGVLSTVSGTIGAGYIGNVGSATETLIKHTRAAIDATAEEVKNAEAMQKQAQAYQAEASQLVLSTQEKRKSAEEAIKLAQSELQVAEALADKKTAHIESMEVLQKEQQYQLKQAELAHQTIGNEKTLAEVVKARSAVQRTQNQIEKQSNAIAQEVWRAEDKVKAAKEAHKKATIELTQAELLEKEAKITSAAADDAATAAKNRATAATKAQAVAMNGLRSVMALLGGPSGILLLAAAGVYALYQAMSNNSSIDDYKNKVNEAIQKVDELTQSQAKAASNQAKIAIKADTKSLEKVAQRIEEVQNAIRYMEESPYEWMEKAGAMAFTYESRLASLKDKLDELMAEHDTYNGSIQSLEKQQDILNKASESGAVAIGDAAKSVKILKSEYNSLSSQQEILNELFTNGAQAAELLAYKLNLENKYAEQGVAITDDIRRSIDDAVASKKQLMETQGAANLKQQLDSIKTNVEALKIEYQQGAEAAAVFRAEQFLSKQDGLDPKLAKEYIEGIKQQYEWQGKVNTKNKESSSSLKNSKKDMEQATNAIQRQLAEIERLNKGYEEGSKKLAQYDAVKALGDKASPEQKAQAERLAGELFDIEQRLADKRAALAANATATAEKLKSDEIEQLDRQLKANLVTEEQYQKRRAEINAEYSKKIAEENAKSVITPTQEMAGQLDPVQQLANENAQKLALIQEYVNQKVLTEEQGLALMNAANREYEQSRFDAMWGLWKGQNDLNNLMGTAIDSLSSGTATAVSAMLSGTQSAGDAMRNLANTALNAMIQQLMQMAVQALITRTILGTFMGGLGAIPNIASVASSVTSLSNIGGMGMPTDFRSYGGGRYNGGSVNPNSYYRFGEGGKPEILQTSSGKNYLLPGEGGKVIPNKDLQGGGSLPPIINVYQQASGATVDVSTEKGLNAQDVINIVVRNIMEGREISGAVSTHHNAPRKATGSL
ncbi:hypothetical protein AB6F89_15275 [Providencia hangzhouensis]|uniref:hypothetical protein n=1 Tax=Providencia hangzhouensis TaxID=3031799 RepID=UPI0034DD75AE